MRVWDNMKDRDLENQILVRLDDATYNLIIDVADATESFKGQVVRRCIMRCIRQDRSAGWKKWIARLIGY